jgi:hypothetical protein
MSQSCIAVGLNEVPVEGLSESVVAKLEGVIWPNTVCFVEFGCLLRHTQLVRENFVHNRNYLHQNHLFIVPTDAQY